MYKGLTLIIKEGNIEKTFNVKKYKKYKCKNCHCEFLKDANSTDADWDEDDFVFCPCCKKKVYKRPMWSNIIKPLIIITVMGGSLIYIAVMLILKAKGVI